MIVIDTILNPVQEIIIAQGLAEAIQDLEEVLNVTVYSNVFAVEATSIWKANND